MPLYELTVEAYAPEPLSAPAVGLLVVSIILLFLSAAVTVALVVYVRRNQKLVKAAFSFGSTASADEASYSKMDDSLVEPLRGTIGNKQ